MLQLQIHFKYLRVSINEVMDDAKEDFCCEKNIDPALVDQHSVPWLYQHGQMKKIISHYQYVIKIANEAETIFNKSVLASFVNLSFLICAELLRLTSVPTFSLQFWKMCVYVLAACTYFFGDCFFTQRVITENEYLVDSCYDVDFVGSNLPFQKCLLLFMARTQKSVVFTIGKFAPVTMVTMITILKASFSYFTLLQKRQNRAST
ncbi:odorant receptor 67a-like [Photinus pyralis]|nr:odorant receptor 67a-like [Photinus pyralis]